MKVIRDNIWLCVDCMIMACNGDATGLDYHYGKDANQRLAEIEAGLKALGPHLVPNFDSNDDENRGIREFSGCGCDCCVSRLAGTMFAFAVLGDE